MARYIGNYEVLRELGAGHYGTVYLANGETPARGRNPAKRRMVAIKRLKDTADHRSVDLLLQEFALLDQVKHRGIVRVFEYLEDDNAVVMEHIHGLTLREVQEALSKAKEQVFTEAAIEIGCELADALYQAYTTPGDNGEPLRLVHRDLKPANVMLTPQGEVKILDFGLARVDNADFAKEEKSRVKGTPIYMAPEQARGEEIDHRTDLFALGLILYELLMNDAAYRVPTNSRDPIGDVYRAIEGGELTRQCTELEMRLPAHGPIVTRLLQRRPEDRYQTGQDALVDLRRQLYRDRGSYLKEFCEFLYGSIKPIGDAPGPEEASSASRTSARGRRLTIEERLRQSMAREQQASAHSPSLPVERARPSGPPSAPSMASGRPPPPPAPAPAPPAAPPPAPQKALPPQLGEPMSSNGSGPPGRKPTRPPVGGAASRAEPFAPAGPPPSANRRPLKQVGQRSPQETGMLEMVPLSADGDLVEANADPSATAFFAIPAPKADRGRAGGAQPGPAPGPSYPSGPPPGMGPMGGSPPPPPGMGMGGPPPPMGYGAPPPPPGVPGPPVYASQSPPQMIQGPVAGYGGGASQTPFQVAGPVPGAAPVDPEQRVQSTRLYAILFACMVLIVMAVVVAVWLRPGSGDEATATVATAAPSAATVVDAGTRKKEVDTGVAAPAPTPPPKKSSGGGTKTASSSAAATPAAAPKPSTAPGSIAIRLGDPSAFTSVTVLCPSGFRGKGTFGGGATTVSGVPAGEECSLHFNGGLSPGRFSGARSGSSLTCTMSGTAMVCR